MSKHKKTKPSRSKVWVRSAKARKHHDAKYRRLAIENRTFGIPAHDGQDGSA